MKKIILSLTTILSVNLAIAQINSTSFATRVDFATGTGTSNPQGNTGADLDGDGKNELIVGNLGSSSISMFRNITTSTQIVFSTKIDYPTANTASYIKAVDLDNDGKRDLVTSTNSGTTFSVFRNTTTSVGNITFATRQDFTGQSAPANFDTADVDGDNKVDLIYVNYFSSSFSVFRNTSTLGSISFATRVDYSCGANPGSISVYDIDNDGKKDLAITLYTNSQISIYRNTTTSVGSPTFAFSQNISSPSYPNYINNADLDGDGKNELVTANFYGNNISILKNTTTSVGTITFQTPQNFASGSGTSYPEGIVLEDFDNDTKKDIGVCNRNNNTFSVFKNITTNGTINSSSLASQVTIGANSNPSVISAVDFNNDGKRDLIVTNNQSNNVSILRNQILANEPTIASSNLVFSNTTNNLTTLTFTKGNGSRRMVIVKENAAVNSIPLDSFGYTAKDTFGLGSQLGLGNYVVYSDTGNTFTIKGLNVGSTYYFAVFEYNGTNAYSNYLTTTNLIGSRLLTFAYFSKNSGNLNSLNTWGNNPDGTGTSPSNFSGNNTVYYVANNGSPTIAADWFVTGTNTTIVFGDGSNSGNFTIPSSLSLGVDSFYVNNNFTVTIQGPIYTNKASFNLNSTAQYTLNTAQNIVAASYGNLVLSSSTKTLLGNVTARGTLAMFGNINCNGFTFTLGESLSQLGVLNRSSGSIIGNFKRWFSASNTSGSSGLMPIGTANSYRPIQINYTTAPISGGTLTANFIASFGGNSGLPLFDFTTTPVVQLNKTAQDGFWRLAANDGLTGGNFTSFVTGAGFSGISSVSDLRLVKRSSPTGSWSLAGSSVIGSGSISVPVVSAQSMSNVGGDFAIASDSSINSLPVTLVSINASWSNAQAQLNWQTASEQNNSHFEIEKLNYNEWKTIGIIKGAGNSNQLLKYQFVDNESNLDAKKEAIYYRLKQVDFDGNYNYSELVLLQYNTNNEIKIFPNPFQNTINISVENGEEIKEITIIDLHGKEILQRFGNQSKFDASMITPGLYTIKIVTNLQTIFTKIIK
ncbi:MAG: T9SS type A sorting domain-containing protein [Bacteroidota bacterium]